MNELTRRLLFGVPAAAVFLWLTWLGGLPFRLLLALIALAAAVEMVRMFRKFVPGLSLILTILIALFFWLAGELPGVVTILIASVLMLATLLSLFTSHRPAARYWLATLFCSAYAPIGLILFWEIRTMEADPAGFWLALALLLMIWGNDVAAYFGGRRFGKHPLAPRISPKKTWEGFWFGFAGSTAALLLVLVLADPFPLAVCKALPMVLLVGLFGPAGDLLASRMKRIADIKDSSGLLPGHGGMIDRFDALILAAPMVWLYLRWVW